MSQSKAKTGAVKHHAGFESRRVRCKHAIFGAGLSTGSGDIAQVGHGRHQLTCRRICVGNSRSVREVNDSTLGDVHRGFILGTSRRWFDIRRNTATAGGLRQSLRRIVHWRGRLGTVLNPHDLRAGPVLLEPPQEFCLLFRRKPTEDGERRQVGLQPAVGAGAGDPILDDLILPGIPFVERALAVAYWASASSWEVAGASGATVAT
jgi:hypothetical protein